MAEFTGPKDLKEPTIEYWYAHFGPYLFHTTVKEEIVNRLKKEAYECTEKYNYGLAGHLDHQYLFPSDIRFWFYEAMAPIFTTYRKGHCKYHGFDYLPVEFAFADLWVNIMKAGDFNPPHYHGGNLSFVLFLSTPEGLEEEQKKFEGTSEAPGTITFEYGETSSPHWSTVGKGFKPKVGSLYIFPSLLRHWVSPFKCAGDRVSVSGNLLIKEKKDFPWPKKKYF